MFTIYVRAKPNKQYIKFKNCRTYKTAYYRIGDWLQKHDTLHYSYSLKYMMDGWDKRKVFPYGSTYLKRKQIEFKISAPQID